MTQREPNPQRRPNADEIENWAFGLLEGHLIDHGHAVTNVRRPDRTNRTSRDVDFLVEVDGRDVAVEVTQLDQAREWWNLLSRLEAHIRSALCWKETVAESGWLLLSINLLRTASYREVETSAIQIADSMRDAPADLGGGSWKRLAALTEPARSLVDVEVRRASKTGRQLTFVKSNEAHGSMIASRALAFVRHLIASKGTQAAGYREVWILVIDNELIIDVGELDAAFGQEAETLPPNWTRLYFIPAADREAIQSLKLQDRRRG